MDYKEKAKVASLSNGYLVICMSTNLKAENIKDIFAFYYVFLLCE